MTDRELLEMAAKAIGETPERWTVGSESPSGLLLRGVQHPWNPLRDDGDALRLAVKLGLVVEIDNELGGESSAWRYGEAPAKEFIEHEEDPYAATRRAVVLAAAEIGRAMP